MTRKKKSNITYYLKKKEQYKDVVVPEDFTKYCKGCNQTKNQICFRRNKVSKDGLRSICKSCLKEQEDKRTALRKENNIPPPPFKTCNICKIEKPSVNFGIRSGTLDGLATKCKDCANEKARRLRAPRAVEINEKNRIRRQKRVQWLRDLKSYKNCADCNRILNPILMDFDHVIGEKKHNVSYMVVHNFSKEDILKEIEKTELVCLYCHYDRTFRRLEERKKKNAVKRFNKGSNKKIKLLKYEYINKYKESHPCYVCGLYYKAHHMQLDHVDPNIKYENISKLVFYNVDMDIIQEEINKCQCICCGCHRIKSLEEQDNREIVKSKNCIKCSYNKPISNFIHIEKSIILEKDICKKCISDIKSENYKKRTFIDIENKTRICSKCLIIKHFSEFPARQSGPAHLDYCCISCKNNKDQ